MTGAGNPIAIAPNEEVVLFDYDIEEKQKLANSFEKLIEDSFINWLKKPQQRSKTMSRS